jgi:hypothetical protein
MLFKQELASVAINTGDRADAIHAKIDSADKLLATLASDIEAELTRSMKLKRYLDEVSRGNKFLAIRVTLEEKEVTDLINLVGLLEYAERLIRARVLLRAQLRSRTQGEG